MASKDSYALSNGTIKYRVRWRFNGKPKSASFSTPRQAEQWIHLIEAAAGDTAKAEAALIKAIETGPTVAENLHRHIELLTSAGPYQTDRYRRTVSWHFNDNFGNMPVAEVTYSDVADWVNLMSAKTHNGKPLSAKTIANHHGLLAASMETAIRLGRRTSNPCQGIRLPKSTATVSPMYVMTGNESLRVINANPERYQDFLHFLRGSGSRFSEATALLGTDFTFRGSDCLVRIDKAWKLSGEGANNYYVGAPKTKKSRRTISLAPSLAEMLRDRAHEAGSGLMFTSSYGNQIRHSSFFQFWTQALDGLGYHKGVGVRPRIHDLRHTHASMMLAAGLSMYELSRRLGHSSIQITVDIYSHLTEDAHSRGADAAARAFG